jgi:hypothetical protein
VGTSVALLTNIFKKCLGPDPQGPRSYLDVGAQNLYGGTPDDYRAFVTYCLNSASLTKELDDACVSLAERSRDGTAQHPWCAELFDLVSWDYESLDLYNGTIKADLNVFQLEKKHLAYFDFVANFGTTEHVLNQFLVLSNIHYAARPGGFIIHFLPSSGFFYHCLFSYNPKLFLLLAKENSYKIVHAALFDQGSVSPVDERHRSWAEYRTATRINAKDVLAEFIFLKEKQNDFRGCYDVLGNDNEIKCEFDTPCSSVRHDNGAAIVAGIRFTHKFISGVRSGLTSLFGTKQLNG